MKITETEVEYVARLANIEIPAGEKAELASQLSRILDYVDQLNTLDLAGIEPALQTVSDSRHAVRDDQAVARPGSSDAQSAAKPFKVPKVITER